MPGADCPGEANPIEDAERRFRHFQRRRALLPPPALTRCRDLHHPRGHSTDSATPGSTRAARRAGTQHARVATAPSTSGTATNVAKSVGGTP